MNSVTAHDADNFDSAYKGKDLTLILISILKSVRMHEGGWPSKADQDLDSSQ